MRTPTKNSFLNDVKEHVCTCLLNDGLYRHYSFKKLGTKVFAFEIITWPNYLCFCGDMGSYVFQRVEDMFSFFRHDDINPDYWSQKLEAVDKCSDYKEWSSEKFEDAVREYWEDYFMDGTEDTANAVWGEIEDHVLRYSENKHDAYSSIGDFVSSYDNQFDFCDLWLDLCEEYAYRFIWCCYALVWGIGQIDRLGEKNG